MSDFGYRKRLIHFTEGGPDTTNVRWGIERILDIHGLLHGGSNCREAIVALERYFQAVFGLSAMQMLSQGGTPTASDIAVIIDMAALEVNVEFPEEEHR